MEENEITEEEVLETSQPAEVEPKEGISDIFESALKDKAGSPEEPSQLGEEKEEGQVAAVKAEKPFGELTIDEAKKLTFKSDKDFQAFLEKNPFLKEKVMFQSDYTKKTMQVAEERKKFEKQLREYEETKAKESQAWGTVQPTPEDMGFFQNLWQVYQYGSEPLAQQISAFAKDVALISQGRNPVGPLAGNKEQPNDFTKDSQVIGVKREFDSYRLEQERKEKQREAVEQAQAQEKAVAEVNSWLSEKKKAGVIVTQEERNEMANLSVLRDSEGNRLSLDELHDLALARLGKTIKKVVTDVKDHAKRTPSKPASRFPSNAKPESDKLEDIFSQGQELLSQG